MRLWPAAGRTGERHACACPAQELLALPRSHRTLRERQREEVEVEGRQVGRRCKVVQGKRQEGLVHFKVASEDHGHSGHNRQNTARHTAGVVVRDKHSGQQPVPN